MIQLHNLRKTYIVGDSEQIVLNNVSINFRDSEFVTIFGPSGSGKTTLLNLIGGLDGYDEGDIIINHISTKQYEDKDWDIYRNHTVGFIFQHYNLIPHQSVLSNVELALTVNGMNEQESQAAAKTALYQVGLTNHLYKTPNQLSGGQMQRVAIARALVNNPDIILADEPTGALDSETSTQIMNLLKNIAKDRLVIMVTHNQELAERYATRIVQLKDGQIIDDTNPYDATDPIMDYNSQTENPPQMKFKTALRLSWDNLKTKKARTSLISLASSIGIVGISLIIALSAGVNKYIDKSQKEIMVSYPIEIQKEAIDIQSAVVSKLNNKTAVDTKDRENAIYANMTSLGVANSVSQSIIHNDLKTFKSWLDDSSNQIHKYIRENGIEYKYDVPFEIYSYDKNAVLVTSEGVNIEDTESETLTVSNSVNAVQVLTGQKNTIAQQILSNKEGQVDNAVKENYELIAGHWPSEPTEVVLMLDCNMEISAIYLYSLGLLPAEDYNNYIQSINDANTTYDPIKIDIQQALNQTLYFVVPTDKYIKNEEGWFDYYGNGKENLYHIVDNYSTKVSICGIIKSNSESSLYQPGIGYTAALTNYLIQRINNSNVVLSQQNTPDINVLNGYAFVAQTDEDKINEVKYYFEMMTDAEKAEFARNIIKDMYGESESTTNYLAEMTITDLINLFNQYHGSMIDNDYLLLYDDYITSGSYEKNMRQFGIIDESTPIAIDIYVDTFDYKNHIIQCIQEYNSTHEESQQIAYTDYIGTMMASITTIINSVSYILISFVAVSLIVSFIMIGIIINISVIERTKEIGILRAVGASRHSISNIFNAESFIIGTASGILGILISYILTIPINRIIYLITNTTEIKATPSFISTITLIGLSVIITIIAGLMPARKAAKMNPVKALRSR